MRPSCGLCERRQCPYAPKLGATPNNNGVALDAEIMAGMPPHVTAATGMDALTHAIESFLSESSGPGTESNVRMAVPLIFGNLQTAYSEGSNLEALVVNPDLKLLFLKLNFSC